VEYSIRKGTAFYGQANNLKVGGMSSVSDGERCMAPDLIVSRVTKRFLFTLRKNLRT
jgi:hypothetical protein